MIWVEIAMAWIEMEPIWIEMLTLWIYIEITTPACVLELSQNWDYGDLDEDYEMIGIEMLTIEISMWDLAFVVHKSVEDSRNP